MKPVAIENTFHTLSAEYLVPKQSRLESYKSHTVLSDLQRDVTTDSLSPSTSLGEWLPNRPEYIRDLQLVLASDDLR